MYYWEQKTNRECYSYGDALDATQADPSYTVALAESFF